MQFLSHQLNNSVKIKKVNRKFKDSITSPLHIPISPETVSLTPIQNKIIDDDFIYPTIYPKLYSTTKISNIKPSTIKTHNNIIKPNTSKYKLTLELSTKQLDELITNYISTIPQTNQTKIKPKCSLPPSSMKC